nr:MAG TPA: hypothetical protein [Caudoviricetes sp.]
MSVNSFRPPPACHQMMSRGIFNCYGSLDHAADILHSFGFNIYYPHENHIWIPIRLWT